MSIRAAAMTVLAGLVQSFLCVANADHCTDDLGTCLGTLTSHAIARVRLADAAYVDAVLGMYRPWSAPTRAH